MNIEFICEESICEACNKEKATKIYDTYSNVDGGSVIERLLCDKCYWVTVEVDWD